MSEKNKFNNIIKDEFGNYFLLLKNGAMVTLKPEPEQNEIVCPDLNASCIGSGCIKWQNLGIYIEHEQRGGVQLGYCVTCVVSG